MPGNHIYLQIFFCVDSRMKQIKTKGMTIKVPKGNAFPYKTPPMCPKAHILCGVFGKRGASKSTSTVNLMSEMGYDRAFVISLCL